MAASNTHSFNKLFLSTMNQAHYWVVVIKRMSKENLVSTCRTLLCCYLLLPACESYRAPLIYPKGLSGSMSTAQPSPFSPRWPSFRHCLANRELSGPSSARNFYSDLVWVPLKWTPIPETLHYTSLKTIPPADQVCVLSLSSGWPGVQHPLNLWGGNQESQKTMSLICY